MEATFKNPNLVCIAEFMPFLVAPCMVANLMPGSGYPLKSLRI